MLEIKFKQLLNLFCGIFEFISSKLRIERGVYFMQCASEE